MTVRLHMIGQSAVVMTKLVPHAQWLQKLAERQGRYLAQQWISIVYWILSFGGNYTWLLLETVVTTDISLSVKLRVCPEAAPGLIPCAAYLRFGSRVPTLRE